MYQVGPKTHLFSQQPPDLLLQPPLGLSLIPENTFVLANSSPQSPDQPLHPPALSHILEDVSSTNISPWPPDPPLHAPPGLSYIPEKMFVQLTAVHDLQIHPFTPHQLCMSLIPEKTSLQLKAAYDNNNILHSASTTIIWALSTVQINKCNRTQINMLA